MFICRINTLHLRGLCGLTLCDMPAVFAPLQQCLKDAAEAVQKEAKKDPVPQFSSKQVKTTTNWLKAAVSAMQEDNLAQEP